MPGSWPPAAALAAEVRLSAALLAGRVRRTELVAGGWLSAVAGAEVRLKLECRQRTGSFKIRGACRRLLALDPVRRRRGVVCASTGNHGAAVACAGLELEVPVTVFVPAGAEPAKLARIRRLGAGVEIRGRDCVEAEAAARAEAAATGRTYVSPYNDPLVVAGQGTVGLEVVESWPEVEEVYVAVGGGGLAAGVAAAVKDKRPDLRVVGCSPSASAVMAASVRAGRILDLPSAPTLSDGTAGGLEPGAITFPLCRELIDDWIEVEEAEIAAAVLGLLERERILVEGAAGVAAAGLRRAAAGRSVGRAAVILCGGNLPRPVLRGLLAGPAAGEPSSAQR
ncbi:MAG: pyridoxal-phosphate dependent enzyme [Planctomycetota bacterium]|nr:MAG: pyridoxal-phosphate dependent enzyme [Planctomycetota bacterium]